MHKLPDKLVSLIEKGIWPKSDKDMGIQEFDKPLISSKIVKSIFPEENKIVFLPFPFRTAAEENKHSHYLLPTKFSTGLEASLESILLIGDFGSGSDLMLGLYYGEANSEPSVVKEYCDFSSGNENKWWHKEFDSFGEFLRAVKLAE